MLPYQPQLTAQDVEIISEKLCYQGYLKLIQYQLRHRLFNGGWSPVLSRELLINKPAVGVLLFDPLRDEILLVEQFRASRLISEPQQSPWILEIVAGMIEPEEEAVDVAKREAKEEANCTILDIIPIYEYSTSPGVSNGKFHLFCAHISSANAGGLFGLSEEHEDIRAQVFPKQFVYAALKNGLISNAATLIAVQWLQLNEASVKKRWLD